MGTHRVLEPPGVLPQQAWRLDPDPRARSGEVVLDVERLNLNAAPLRQLREQHGDSAERSGQRSATSSPNTVTHRLVREREPGNLGIRARGRRAVRIAVHTMPGDGVLGDGVVRDARTARTGNTAGP